MDFPSEIINHPAIKGISYWRFPQNKWTPKCRSKKPGDTEALGFLAPGGLRSWMIKPVEPHPSVAFEGGLMGCDVAHKYLLFPASTCPQISPRGYKMIQPYVQITTYIYMYIYVYIIIYNSLMITSSLSPWPGKNAEKRQLAR